MNHYKIFLKERPDIDPQIIPVVIEGLGVTDGNAFKIEVDEGTNIIVPVSNVLLACEVEGTFISDSTKQLIEREPKDMQLMINEMFPVEVYAGETT